MYEVTLAIPVYNVEEYVERALLSALNQSFESIEYLIVDDKGTDTSMDIVRRIIASHPRGRHIRIEEHENNRGTGAARNSAIDAAQGKFLFFMDSDDEILPDCIRILYAEIVNSSLLPDFVLGSYGIVNDSSIIPRIFKDTAFTERFEMLHAVFRDKMDFLPATWNKLYRLDFLRQHKIRCYPEHSWEDQIFTFQVLFTASVVRIIPDVTYLYYQRENSIMGLVSKGLLSASGCKQFPEIVEFKKQYLSRLQGNPDCRQLNDALLWDAVRYTIYVLKNKNLNRQKKKVYAYRLLNFSGFAFPSVKRGNLKLLLLYLFPFDWRYKILKLMYN